VGRHRTTTPILFTVCALGFAAGASAQHETPRNPCGPGIFVAARQAKEPVQAWFAARSYRPGTNAALWVRAHASRASVRVYQLVGSHWSVEVATSNVQLRGTTQRLAVPIGDWPSGLYLAEVSTDRGSGSSLFVVRPAHAGENRVAVVLPTNTWAAYNFRDDDRNGYGDIWYADPGVHTVVLARPFLKTGLPRQLGGFVHWLAGQDLRADFYSDEDLDAVPTGDRLASLYDLVVFPGHEEYVTRHVFSIVERYRNVGGNLAFLSANNFYAQVRIEGGRMTCLGHFRDFGKPEAQLVGVQYVDWFRRAYRNRPYVVRSIGAAPWLFNGTGLRTGDTFGFSYGVEIDARAPSSPPSTRVIAEIPSVFGPGKTAQMTYYRTLAGAKVFAAGAMNFDAPQSDVTDRMLRNLWDFLSRP
jgi:N,N-dimethylformamidase beta subunit-like protein